MQNVSSFASEFKLRAVDTDQNKIYALKWPLITINHPERELLTMQHNELENIGRMKKIRINCFLSVLVLLDHKAVVCWHHV